MGVARISFVALLCCVAGIVIQPSRGQLSYNFYANSCPFAESIIRTVLTVELARDPTSPAALLRLFFHDCIVQGCDASILLDSQGGIVSERVSAANFGIRRLQIIDNMKAALEAVCPNTVSCADIVVLAAKEALSRVGGPSFQVPLGRRDSTTASNLRADAEIPPPTISLSGFIAVFAATGMTLTESVAILGGHTLGVGHCVSITNRLYPQKDPKLGILLYSVLRLQCPPRFFSNTTVFPNDPTSLVFDTQYFSNSLARRGLFTIDSEVATDPRTAPIVRSFSVNPPSFFQSFSSAFVKLSLANVLTGAQGEIRQNCRLLN